MALDVTVFAADTAAVIADMPAVLVFGAQTVSVTRMGRDVIDGVEMAGFVAGTDEECMALVSSFTTLPACGDAVTLGGDSYHVKQVRKSPDGMTVHLMLSER